MFHHSHMQFQRGNGVFGAYIVRQSRQKDPHAHLYDFDLTDHVIFVQEYFHRTSEEVFAFYHWDTGLPKLANHTVLNVRIDF